MIAQEVLDVRADPRWDSRAMAPPIDSEIMIWPSPIDGQFKLMPVALHRKIRLFFGQLGPPQNVILLEHSGWSVLGMARVYHKAL